MAAAGGAGGAAAAYNANIRLRESLLVISNSVPFIALKTREPARNSMGFATFKPINKKDCIQYFQEYILFDNEVFLTDPGIHTWILKDFDNGLGRHLVASRTFSGQELGTLHANINQFTKPGNVIIAGELLIMEDEYGHKSYNFNILSGTYSAKLTAAQQASGVEALRNYVRTFGIEPNIVPHGKILEAHGFVLPPLPKYLEKNYLGMCLRSEYVPPPGKGGARRHSRRRGRKHRRTLKRGQ